VTQPERPSTFAIGDIHGNRPALDDLLARIAGLVASGDSVVFLGDYIDRGRDSKGCIDAILAFTASTAASVVCLRGNHEDWLLDSLRDPRQHSWLLGMDGYVTIRSYSRAVEQEIRARARDVRAGLYDGTEALPYHLFTEVMPPGHLEFLEGLGRRHRDAHGVYVHAGVHVDRPDAESRYVLTHGLDDGGFPQAYRGEALVVYGHRNNAELDADGWPWPRRIRRTLGLDTSRHGVISAVRLPDDLVVQSRRYVDD
jgi:serine/threonine protein phosphatase 1